MKIVRLIGGLGNQMWQYALAYALQSEYPDEEVRVDASYFRTQHAHNGLELERVFGLTLPRATQRDLWRVTLPLPSYRLTRLRERLHLLRPTELVDHADPDLIRSIFRPGPRYYSGYWQDHRYIIRYRDALRSLFTFRLPLGEANERFLARDLRHAVAIHVRRGDYLGEATYTGLCGEDYYRQAIAHMLSLDPEADFYLFSNDIPWCRQHIVPLLGARPHAFVDWNRGPQSALDIYLMSRLPRQIIAASSFSWWAAFLCEDPRQAVCAPQRWTNNHVYTIRPLPEWRLY